MMSEDSQADVKSPVVDEEHFDRPFSAGRPTYVLTRWLFLRALGLIYFVAFVSFWAQAEGLIGSNGILPAAEFLAEIEQQLGAERFWLAPTLFWLNRSDTFLHLLCGGGALLSLLLIVGSATGPVLLLLWLFYLSLVTIGQVFLGYQWDNLLLETGLLAVFIAPWQMERLEIGDWRLPISNPSFDDSGPSLRTGLQSSISLAPVSRITLWLLRWLMFRLMFMSGAVKLLSGDPTWRSLTALTFHYETQPLPTGTSWYVHQLPEWFQRASVLGVFAVELVVPFLIFTPRRLRFASGAVIVALQLLILLTGNYTFFNWLTIALCIPLYDDAFWQRFFPRRWLPAAEEIAVTRQAGVSNLRRLITATFAILILFASGVQMAGLFVRPLNLPQPARQFLTWVAPFRSVNRYGLFAVMTTSRPEIIVEGSNDGETWLAYDFKWKPDDLHERPHFVAPHQPRLDWQMWFAALGRYQNNPWLINFMVRLLEGSPEVLSLLAGNPFPDTPPRFMRAVVYDYRFTDWETRQATGAWWTRERVGLYAPELSRP
ncbi:MAG TPA: lipase maturation factor family protein [Anaerolineae bacterium]